MPKEVQLLNFLLGSKAICHFLVHTNFANFFVRLIKGFAIAEKFGINFL